MPYFKPNIVFTAPATVQALAEALAAVEERTRGAVYRHCALVETDGTVRWFFHIDVLGVRKRLIAADPRFAFSNFDEMKAAEAARPATQAPPPDEDAAKRKAFGERMAAARAAKKAEREDNP